MIFCKIISLNIVQCNPSVLTFATGTFDSVFMLRMNTSEVSCLQSCTKALMMTTSNGINVVKYRHSCLLTPTELGLTKRFQTRSCCLLCNWLGNISPDRAGSTLLGLLRAHLGLCLLLTSDPTGSPSFFLSFFCPLKYLCWKTRQFISFRGLSKHLAKLSTTAIGGPFPLFSIDTCLITIVTLLSTEKKKYDF